jgi:hypothetical protein
VPPLSDGLGVGAAESVHSLGLPRHAHLAKAAAATPSVAAALTALDPAAAHTTAALTTTLAHTAAPTAPTTVTVATHSYRRK